LIKVFDSLTDTTPTIFADVNVNVYNFWDRGLLGLDLDPNFPTNPFVYVLYTYDGAIGGVAPRWGTPGVYSDPCPNPLGATGDGCIVSAPLSRLEAAGNVMTGSEQVLIEDWCQQYPSHSIGSWSSALTAHFMSAAAMAPRRIRRSELTTALLHLHAKWDVHRCGQSDR
jgi:hypothetical protein